MERCGALFLDPYKLAQCGVEIVYDAGEASYTVFTAFDAGFVADIKAKVPAYLRAWDRTRKAWIVKEGGAMALSEVLNDAFNTGIDYQVSAERPVVAPEVLEVHYIGLTKTRKDGSETSFGHNGVDWAFVFPKDVLTAYFADGEVVTALPTEAKTYFAALGVPETATSEQVRKGYRRAIRQWHPDVCDEPDANVQFLAIQKAKDVLLDDVLRARYMAGLKLAQSLGSDGEESRYQVVFRPPYRCGRVVADVERGVRLTFVHRILSWEELRNAQGQVLVSSWPNGASMYQEKWV